ncbi:MAG: hypothetical protein H6853_01315 [Rhodospirillales bacterium]|nr:hypothetical protein [Alphaproteobacteria bacterium]USO03949.1 MAG: hypothetical protein H6853_01315 [Rhodospirillales bacterium]
MSIEDFTTFLGWVCVINIAILTLSSLLVIVLRDSVSGLHARLFSLKKDDVLRAYFEYLGQLKILVIVFNLAPYIALKIMY